jgi:hypothetical protein
MTRRTAHTVRAAFTAHGSPVAGLGRGRHSASRRPPPPLSRSTCRPSPCGRLSRPRTTTAAPSPVGLAPRRRSRVPSSLDVRARRRCPVRHLAGPQWSVPVGRRAEPSQACTGSVPTAPRQAWCGGRCVAPLVTGVRAVSLSPYRAGLAGLRRTRLPPPPASPACCFPLGLSSPGRPGDPRPSLLV